MVMKKWRHLITLYSRGRQTNLDSPLSTSCLSRFTVKTSHQDFRLPCRLSLAALIQYEDPERGLFVGWGACAVNALEAWSSVVRRGCGWRDIEVTPSDIALANDIAQEVLGRSLDELLPQTRKLLTLLHEWVTTECTRLNLQRSEFRLTRRQLREALGWGDTQLKVHLSRLVELELLLVHRGNPGYAYELLYEGEDADGRAKLLGLIDCTSLQASSQGAGHGRALVGGRSGGGRGAVDPLNASQGEALSPVLASEDENRTPGVSQNPVLSYPQNQPINPDQVTR